MAEEKEYNQAVKSTGILGSTQVLSAALSIIRTKLIALIVGTSGFGLIAIFQSALSLIVSIADVGVKTSGVRFVSDYFHSFKEKLPPLLRDIKKLFIVLAIGGSLLMVAFSGLLSISFFGDNNHWLEFSCLSLAVFLTVYGSFYQTAIQGLRKLRYLVSSNIYSALVITVVSPAIFLLFKEDGVIPYLCLLALCTCLFGYKYYRKIIREEDIVINNDNTSLLSSLKNCSPLLVLGLMLALNNIVGYVIELLVKSYITREGGLNDIGLYQAGWAINSSYLGMVFNAISTDYYPRLTSSIHDKNKWELCVNSQAEIGILILAPLVVTMLVFIEYVIKILYTDDFLPIMGMASWILVGSMLKVGSWTVSYVFLAKNAGKTFLFNELSIQAISVPLYLIFYKIWGLLGIGYAYVIIYIVYFILVYIVCSKKYGFHYDKSFWSLLLWFSIVVLATIIVCTHYNLWIPKIFLLLLVWGYAGFEFNKRINLSLLINKIIKRKQ